MESPAAAVVWAQFRSLLNFYRRPQMGGYWVGTAVMALWYLMVAAGAILLGFVLSRESAAPYLPQILPFGFLGAFLYWQMVPVFLASTGLSLETRKLVVYPIPENQIFHLEVLLRLSTGIEVILVLVASMTGLLANPLVPKWGPPTMVLFLVFNLYLSAGIKDLISRLMERKGTRELTVLVFVLLMVSPQMVTVMGLPPGFKDKLLHFNQLWMPWTAPAVLAAGQWSWAAAASVLAWLVGAVWFGRWQFHRTLYFDTEAVRAQSEKGGAGNGALEALFAWPRRVFRDPLAALVEKELKSLARTPRFRLVFMMGFTFGLVIWLPLAFGKPMGNGRGAFASNFLTWISVYSIMLLGEVALFNNLGFDRAAAQFYWLAPVRIRTVLLAKNIAAFVYIVLEVGSVTLACVVLRLPIDPAKIAEAFAVTLLLATFFAALGNIGSIYYPRYANPQQAWRSRGGGKFQAWMLLAYPVLAVPIGLAYMARWATESQVAFYAVLAVTAGIGWAFYRVAMDTAEQAAEEKREQILGALSAGDGPIG